MKTIEVFIDNKSTVTLFYEKENDAYGFNYKDNTPPISLIMPTTAMMRA